MLFTMQYKYHWVFTLARPQIQARQPLVVPDVAKHRLHRADALAVELPATRRVNRATHPFTRIVRVGGLRLEPCDLPTFGLVRVLQALGALLAGLAIRALCDVQLVAQTPCGGVVRAGTVQHWP